MFLGKQILKQIKRIKQQLTAKIFRITSYNVCYTKLLRVSIGTVYTEYVSTGVGEGIEVIVVGVDLSGANAAQYSVTTETAPTSTGDITTKELTISGTMANNKTYNSSTVASLTGTTLVGVVAGDVVYLIGGSVAAFEQAEVGTGLIVNTNMYLTGADAANYTVTPPSYNFV